MGEISRVGIHDFLGSVGIEGLLNASLTPAHSSFAGGESAFSGLARHRAPCDRQQHRLN
jgi:hypothetical protein